MQLSTKRIDYFNSSSKDLVVLNSGSTYKNNEFKVILNSLHSLYSMAVLYIKLNMSKYSNFNLLNKRL